MDSTRLSDKCYQTNYRPMVFPNQHLACSNNPRHRAQLVRSGRLQHPQRQQSLMLHRRTSLHRMVCIRRHQSDHPSRCRCPLGKGIPKLIWYPARSSYLLGIYCYPMSRPPRRSNTLLGIACNLQLRFHPGNSQQRTPWLPRSQRRMTNQQGKCNQPGCQ